jgi:ABC-type phosphate/phosphonate transport system permease subunit
MKNVHDEVKANAWNFNFENPRHWAFSVWLTVWDGMLSDHRASERFEVREMIVVSIIGETRR